MTPEGRIKNEIKKVLKEYPSIYAFWPVQSGYGSKTLDVLICARGWFVAVEAKAPGKAPTNLQWVTIGNVQRAGGIAVVVDSVEGARELKDLIEKLGYAPQDSSGTASLPPTTGSKRESKRRCTSLAQKKPEIHVGQNGRRPDCVSAPATVQRKRA